MLPHTMQNTSNSSYRSKIPEPVPTQNPLHKAEKRDGYTLSTTILYFKGAAATGLYISCCSKYLD